ncbi:glutathionylspermidine synthase family protein [Brevundimonas sp. Root1279]|uniref:glutathionylspermidine synthase family protein n=1 Tax=Brevundimonas sp. Root1279 TaxID=1736443 RepID=UPI0006F20A0B|nr:glutathionylspermidine synthase family protein [Brevundimonas sp. Root1279]KQW78678.1 glutathionylspermidine synthase [Brevundimonas sp. Root1279]
MERLPLTPRPDWRERVEALGFVWHTADGQPYWNEAACYRFDRAQVREIEQATEELYRLCLEAGQHIIDRDLFHRFGIPDFAVPLIRKAWDEEPPALNYGRFDLGYDGVSPPKMFEFNCDTPISLLEAAVIQWDWLEAVFPGRDQFNRIHDALIARWRELAPRLPLRVHFTHAEEGAAEDAVTVAYMRDVAREGGVDSVQLPIEAIGWDGQCFVDPEGRRIVALYHLYPWEWLVAEDFGRQIAQAPTQWIEPIWKMIWSNKALLPILWELFPDHPNLLEASFEPMAGDHARKPILAREGANVSIVKDGRVVEATGGDYGDEGHVWQRLYDLPDFDGHRPVIGSWVVDGEAVGMGIREAGLITGNAARFAPHLIRG